MKGRICESCSSITLYHKAYCRKCGEVLKYIKIEDSLDYKDTDFYNGPEYKKPIKSKPSSKNKPESSSIKAPLFMFLTMLLAIPATVFLAFGSCFWGGCDDSVFLVLLLLELGIGVLSLIALIATSFRKSNK